MISKAIEQYVCIIIDASAKVNIKNETTKEVCKFSSDFLADSEDICIFADNYNKNNMDSSELIDKKGTSTISLEHTRINMDKTEFQNSNLFEKYDGWINSMIANYYYSPELYDYEGNLISEASFDEDSFDKAKYEILDISISIYEEIAHGRIFKNHPVGLSDNKVDHASIITDLLHHYDYWDIVLLGTVYYLFVYDYPNYKPVMGNKTLFMRNYNELFTRVSVYIGCIMEWLDLYSSLRNITSVLALPPCLRVESVLKCLSKLKAHGYLDDNYKLTLLARKGSWYQLIAQELYCKGCKRVELEKHFKIGNMRERRDLDRFENRKSKNEAKESDVEIYHGIKNCFV